MSYRRGFTLIELLIFIGIFAVIAGVFVTILVSIVNVQGHQSVTDEIQQQGQFLEQQINYYVQNARLVDMPLDTTENELTLRESSSSQDPTIISAVATSGAISYIQSTSTFAGGNTLSKTFGSPVAKSDVIVVGTFNAPGATITATDTLGDTFTQIVSSTASGDHDSWILIATTTATATDTVTVSGNGSFVYGFSIHEYSGIVTSTISAMVDSTSTIGAVSVASTTLSAGPLTTTNPNDLVFAYFTNANNTNGETINGFSPLYTKREVSGSPTSLCGAVDNPDNCVASEDRILSATTTIVATATQNVADTYTGVAVALKGAGTASSQVYLQQGASGALQGLTSNRVSVSNLYFTRHYNVNSTSSPYGTDSVSYSFTVSAQGGNHTYSQTFQSSVNVFAPVPAVALVQQAKIENNNATSTSLSEGYASANESGDLLLAVVANKNLVTSAITDTAGNTWTQVASTTYSAYSEEVAIFAAPNALAAANTTTVTFGGAGANSPLLFLYEYRGAATSSPLDVWGATTTVDTAAPSSPTVSPGSNVELLFGVDDNAYPTTAAASAGAGFTLESSSTSAYGTQVFTEDMDQYITGAVSAPWTFNSAVSSTAMIAAFLGDNTGSVAHATSTCGPTVQTGLDGGDGYDPLSVPCFTGSDGNGYSVSSISYWVGTPTSANFTLGVYSDSSSNPDTLLCSVTVGTSTPSSGWNTANISGCPTLSANTMYWVGYMTSADGIEQGRFTGDCPGTTLTAAWENSLQSTMALPNPFGGFGFSSTCYDVNMTLTDN